MCRAEYERFGTHVLLESQNEEFDWRIALTVLFYFMYAFTQAVLAP